MERGRGGALAYRLDAISQGQKNSQFPGPNLLPQKHNARGCINHGCINSYMYLNGMCHETFGAEGGSPRLFVHNAPYIKGKGDRMKPTSVCTLRTSGMERFPLLPVSCTSRFFTLHNRIEEIERNERAGGEV
jgi:hypothetical protein